MFEEFIEYVEDNIVEAQTIYDEYYKEMAYELGEDFHSDDDDDVDLEPIEVYEKYAHSFGFAAEFEGARGIIVEMGEDFDDLDEEDDVLKEEILELLGKEV